MPLSTLTTAERTYAGVASFIYGAQRSVYEFDERTLSHLKMAIVSKLRRHEAFLLSWTTPPEEGAGRISLWISRDIPMVFEFRDTHPPQLNPLWLEALLLESNRTGGMDLISEEQAESALRSRAG